MPTEQDKQRQEDDPIMRAVRRQMKQRTLQQRQFRDMEQMINEAIRQHQEQQQREREVG
jgi:hypothetical protein